MQQMLGVSIQNNTHKASSSFSMLTTQTSDKPSVDSDLGSKKVDFNQIFNKQMDSNKQPEVIKKLSAETSHEDSINGESFPVNLNEIGNQLSEFESLADLKNELEAQGFSAKFFDIELSAQNDIEIQPTPDADLQNASMQNYSSILVVQINPESLQGEELDVIDSELSLDELATLALNSNQTQLEDSKELTNPPAIMQWLRVNMTDANTNPSDFANDELTPELNFDPELKMIAQSDLKDMLNKVDNGAFDFLEISKGDSDNVTLVVIGQLQKDDIQDDIIPSHVSQQLMSQTDFFNASVDLNVQNDLNIPVDLNAQIGGVKINTNAVLDDAQLTDEFINTKSMTKAETKLAGLNDQGANSFLESENNSEYEELEIEVGELELGDLELDEPVKTKRAMDSEIAGQLEKTPTTKPGQIELPSINLSDAKATTNANKSTALATADLMQSILPEKQALKLTEEVGSRVMMLHNQKMTTGFIRIDPPELGALEIKIETQGDEAKVTIVTSQLNVKEALDSQANRLRDMLQQQGFVTVDVDVREQKQSDNSQGDGQSNHASGENDDFDLDDQPLVTQEKSMHLLDQFV